MGQYTRNGLLNGYRKNNKERAELDYYATPPQEVENILNKLVGCNFSGKTILEPCVGGGHMMTGILSYLNEHNQIPARLIGTDWKDRGYTSEQCELSYGLDFLADDYPYATADVIIMNPPYATLEPFLIRALEIAKEQLIVLCRTQALEGLSRYNNIYVNTPPSDIYQYIDRIKCWKNGENVSGSSAQAYSWLVWNKAAPDYNCHPPFLYWMHRTS